MSRSAFVRKKGVPENVYEVDKELGGGELSLSMCPGVGNRPPRKKKMQMPGPGGGGAWLQFKLNLMHSPLIFAL